MAIKPVVLNETMRQGVIKILLRARQQASAMSDPARGFEISEAARWIEYQLERNRVERMRKRKYDQVAEQKPEPKPAGQTAQWPKFTYNRAA